uniref:Uncharacterized protein n=1 Tax=Rhodosorus marinus TaxID=101924 RepID=A0A7S2Z8T8_9RHOD|mmetsp:Transcript_10364/g.43160  ORF Transcript_10364/g.43160 Transcript_10364/m.43160 type:complete len:876 (+) Transcript_10364:369-2996(+)|eukprot:CAMPEP_0113963638 /NCGR_PEP_ID=MMETSP0011_2-20120614/6636_1 /TAXON_ID=101924 /ORGANISM="Rhodosorus marinus" /LENGTH=875 /DNA_ID=CAMNT_0000975733 /DNA_START=222 /DNA_END=2849 /DNA_ORIENTATION=+ /assembly_acc=CAM_ASM_000156
MSFAVTLEAALASVLPGRRKERAPNARRGASSGRELSKAVGRRTGWALEEKDLPLNAETLESIEKYWGKEQDPDQEEQVEQVEQIEQIELVEEVEQAEPGEGAADADADAGLSVQEIPEEKRGVDTQQGTAVREDYGTDGDGDDNERHAGNGKEETVGVEISRRPLERRRKPRFSMPNLASRRLSTDFEPDVLVEPVFRRRRLSIAKSGQPTPEKEAPKQMNASKDVCIQTDEGLETSEVQVSTANEQEAATEEPEGQDDEQLGDKTSTLHDANGEEGLKLLTNRTSESSVQELTKRRTGTDGDASDVVADDSGDLVEIAIAKDPLQNPQSTPVAPAKDAANGSNRFSLGLAKIVDYTINALTEKTTLDTESTIVEEVSYEENEEYEEVEMRSVAIQVSEVPAREASFSTSLGSALEKPSRNTDSRNEHLGNADGPSFLGCDAETPDRCSTPSEDGADVHFEPSPPPVRDDDQLSGATGDDYLDLGTQEFGVSDIFNGELNSSVMRATEKLIPDMSINTEPSEAHNETTWRAASKSRAAVRELRHLPKLEELDVSGESDIRRSSRVRFKPLKYWVNESIVYGRKEDWAMPAVVGVMKSEIESKPPLPPTRRPKKKSAVKRKPAPPPPSPQPQAAKEEKSRRPHWRRKIETSETSSRPALKERSDASNVPRPDPPAPVEEEQPVKVRAGVKRSARQAAKTKSKSARETRAVVREAKSKGAVAKGKTGGGKRSKRSPPKEFAAEDAPADTQEEPVNDVNKAEESDADASVEEIVVKRKRTATPAPTLPPRGAKKQPAKRVHSNAKQKSSPPTPPSPTAEAEKLWLDGSVANPEETTFQSGSVIPENPEHRKKRKLGAIPESVRKEIDRLRFGGIAAL